MGPHYPTYPRFGKMIIYEEEIPYLAPDLQVHEVKKEVTVASMEPTFSSVCYKSII
jgi:hypothetical protein